MTRNLLRTRSLPNKGSIQDQDAKFKELKCLIDSIQSEATRSEVQKEQEQQLRARKSKKAKTSTGKSAVSEEYKDPYFDPPPSLGIRSCESTSGEAESNYDSIDQVEKSYLDSDALLHVAVQSSVQSSSFYIPISLMLEREQTMRLTATTFGIGPGRWTESLLYREWRSAQENTSDASSALSPIRAAKKSNGDVAVHMSPEQDCATSNHSHTLIWEPWLTTCIRAFYNTGTVRIPDDCTGSEILLALEYFGIVYMPEQLVFDSFGAYLRVKLWSEYYTHRSLLAEWVVQRILTSHSKHSHTFVTSPTRYESDIIVGSQRATILDGGLELDPAKYDGTPSCAVVHDFFQDEQQSTEATDTSRALDAMMRIDLANYIQNSLPGTQVRFDLREVQVVRSGKLLQRGVLHIDYMPDATVASAEPTVKTDQPSLVRGPSLERGPSIDNKGGRSPIQLLKRVGSGLRSKKSIEDVTTTPSAEHVYEDLQKESRWKKSKKKNRASAVSVDHAYSELAQKGKPEDSMPAVATNPSVPNEPTAAAMAATSPDPPTADDRACQNTFYADPRAPVRSVGAEMDHVSVVSGLTSPFRDEESAIRSIKDQRDRYASVARSRSSLSKEIKQLNTALSHAEIAQVKSRESTAKSRSPIKSRSSKESTNSPVKSPTKSLAASPTKSPKNSLKIPAISLIESPSIESLTVDDGTTIQDQSTTITELFKTHPPPSLAASSVVRTVNSASPPPPACNGGDIVATTFSYFFGESQPCRQQARQTRGRRRVRGHSEDSTKAGAMSTIEKFLPDVDLQSHAATIKNASPRANKADPAKPTAETTMETDAAAWLRDAVSLKKFGFLYEDPLKQQGNDEYARMVRQTPRSREQRAAAKPTRDKTPDIVKDILDALMLDTRTNSFLDGDTEASSMSGTTSLTTMRTKSTRSSAESEETPPNTKARSQLRSPNQATLRRNERFNRSASAFGKRRVGLVDEIDNILDSVLADDMDMEASKRVETSVNTMIASAQKQSPRMTSPGRDSPPQIEAHSQQQSTTPRRRRFPTPSRDRATSAFAPPRKSATKTKRFDSPLKRFPGFLGNRKKEDGLHTKDSDATPQVTNIRSQSYGPSDEEMEPTTSNKKPSRMAGLFRSKGLVRRRSFQGNSKESDTSSRDQSSNSDEDCEEYAARGRLFIA